MIAASFLRQTIQVAHYVTSSSPYHDAVYSVPLAVPARVEYQVSRSFGQNGKDLGTYAVIYTTAEVYPMDKITLPDGTVRQVVTARRVHDEHGVFSHSEVTV